MFKFLKLNRRYFSDYYKILNLKENCTDTEIKKSFLKMAKTYHPDKNPNNEEKFKLILKAYNTLKTKELRHLYNLKLSNPEFDININKMNSSYFKNKKKNYYDTKYYNYERPSDDIRNDENINKDSIIDKFYTNGLYKAAFIISIFMIYEYLIYRKNQKHKRFLDIKREISNEDENNISFYIENCNNNNNIIV